MDRPKPPTFPVVHVTMRPEGAAQVNLAGEHHLFAGSSPEDSREQVIAYATTQAVTLGRGIRMRLVDEDGTFDLAVYPDGAVQRLEQPSPSRRRQPALTAAPAPAAPRVVAAPVAPPGAIAREPIADPPTVLDAPHQLASTPAAAVAILRFSTGETHEFRDRAIVGRRGKHSPEPDGWSRVEIDDPSGTVSRSHAAIQFNDGELWIADLGSANGTSIRRGDQVVDVDTTSTQLRAGDVIELGVRVTAQLSIEAAAEVNR